MLFSINSVSNSNYFILLFPIEIDGQSCEET